MLLICYFVLIFLLYFLLHTRNEATKKSGILLYNWLFWWVIYGILLLFRDYGSSYWLTLVLRAASEAFQTITFQFPLWNYSAEFAVFGNVQFAELQLAVILFFTLLCTAYTVVFAIFRRHVTHGLLALRARFRQQQYIVTGYHEEYGPLVASIFAHDRHAHVILITSDAPTPDDPFYYRIQLEGPNYWRKLRPGVSYKIAALSGGGQDNIALLKRLNELGEGYRLEPTILLDNELFRFECLSTNRLNERIVSFEALLIDNWLSEHPPILVAEQSGLFQPDDVGFPRLKRPFNIAIIGFGQLGREFLLSTYERSAFLRAGNNGDVLEDSLHALIIDPRTGTKRSRFEVDAPHFAESSAITWCQAEANTPEYYQALKAGDVCKMQQIFIATPDSQVNARTGIQLAKLLQRRIPEGWRPQVIVCMHEKNCNMEMMLEKAGSCVLRTYEDIFTWENFVSRKGDAAAMAVHDRYGAAHPETSVPWRELDTMKKSSNRMVAADIPVKLRLAELSRESGSFAGEESLIQALMQYEHNRWCAFHFARGWRTLPADALTEKERREYVTKRSDAMEHTCLVPWETLDTLPQRREHELKESDRINVEDAFAASAGKD